MRAIKLLAITLCVLPSFSCAQQGQSSESAAKQSESAATPPQGRDIYANPQNLEVLAKSISSAELRDTMKSFATGLGMRCQSCHIGQEGQPLSTFDFASDEKTLKQKARVMLRMVQQINGDHLSQLDAIGKTDQLEVRCVTCHRGQAKPALIQDVLNEQLAANSVTAAVEKYEELRAAFHGSHSYDFSEFTLPMYAEELAKSQQTDAAIAFTELNAKYFPDSYYTQFILGQLYRASGEPDQAIKHLQRAVELNPQMAPMLQPVIQSLRRG